MRSFKERYYEDMVKGMLRLTIRAPELSGQIKLQKQYTYIPHTVVIHGVDIGH